MRSVPEVADRLGVSIPTAWRLIYNRELACVRIRTVVRVRDEDLDAYIKANLQERKREAQ